MNPFHSSCIGQHCVQQLAMVTAIEYYVGLGRVGLQELNIVADANFYWLFQLVEEA